MNSHAEYQVFVVVVGAVLLWAVGRWNPLHVSVGWGIENCHRGSMCVGISTSLAKATAKATAAFED